jgi:quercetin dioxygenase-like cupin family protein
MKKRNVWSHVKQPLELHTDKRGTIADIFYKENIQHVAIIKSKKGARRGDHYHKKTVQHMLITKGSLEYWHKPLESSLPAKCEVLRVGDIVSTPSHEIHALRMVNENEFVVFTTGKRGGKDYESDTFRVKPSIIPT